MIADFAPLQASRSIRLIDRTLSTEVRDGEVIAERTLGSARDLSEAMRDIFKVTPPVPAEEVFGKIAVF